MDAPRRILSQAALLVLLSVAAGFATHVPLVKRFLAGEFRETFLSSAEYPGIRLITTREAEDLFAAGGASLFFDAREAGHFRQGHVPGARSLPYDGPGTRIPDAVLALSRDLTLIVYCEGGDCRSSLGLARLLHDKGFKDIRVMTGGWAEWSQAGLPAETGDGQK